MWKNRNKNENIMGVHKAFNCKIKERYNFNELNRRAPCLCMILRSDMMFCAFPIFEATERAVEEMCLNELGGLRIAWITLIA